MSNQWTSKQKDDLVRLLCETVETVTANPPGGEEKLAKRLAGYLSGMGCEAWVEKFAPGRANLISVLNGREHGPALMLNGHLDTVPFGEEEAWKTPPVQAVIRDGILYGRGASDMKSGLCAALYAFGTLASQGFIPQNDILFVATGDEESMGLGAQAVVDSGLLEQAGKIVIGEPTGNRIAVASKGTLWLKITTKGKTSHGAYPLEGINAIGAALTFYGRVKALIQTGLHPYLSEPTCTLTMLSGGVKTNMVPDTCEMALDIRTVPPISHPALLKQIAKAACETEQLYSGAQISFSVLNDRAAVEILPEHELVRDLQTSVEAVCGGPAELSGTGFFSDASIFLKNRSIPVILFGPGESAEAHKPNESVRLESYFDSAACYQNFLLRQ